MMIHEITEKVGKHRARKRVGRGEASGLGKTSGRGHKGAASRSGWSLRPAYQGGQINFIQKLPKRGFTNAEFKKTYTIVNVKALEKLGDEGGEITIESLAAAGLVRDADLPLKVLGEGELTRKVTVTAAKFSASARAKIEAAGGTANEIVPMKWSRSGPVPAVRKSAVERKALAARKAEQRKPADAPQKSKGKKPKNGEPAEAAAKAPESAPPQE